MIFQNLKNLQVPEMPEVNNLDEKCLNISIKQATFFRSMTTLNFSCINT